MEALLIEAFFFGLCEKACVFLKQEVILSSIVLVTLREWLVLRNKLNYTLTKIGAKVQPHQPSVLIVYSTQMLKVGFSCLW